MTPTAPLGLGHREWTRHLVGDVVLDPATNTRETSPILRLKQIQHPCIDLFEPPPAADHIVIMPLGHALGLERWIGGSRLAGQFEPTTLLLAPAGETAAWRWEGAPAVLHLYLDAAKLDAFAEEELDLDPARLKLIERFAHPDAFAWAFATQLTRRLLRGPVDALLYDVAGIGFACHVLKQHSTSQGGRPGPVGRLNRREAARVEDFLDDMVAEEFGLDDVADATGVRRIDLVRSFVTADGEGILRALRSRRIGRAHDALRQGERDLPAIARKAGFSSIQSLRSAFWFRYGCALESDFR